MKSLKVLVTGGAGFIGSRLAGELVGRGYSVVVLDNFHSGSMENLHEVSGEDSWRLLREMYETKVPLERL